MKVVLPSPPPESADDETAVVAFVMEAGRALLAAGASTPSVEPAMFAAAARFGLHVEVFALPTMLQAAFGPPDRQRHAVLRLEPGGVDLGRRALAEGIIARAIAGEISATNARTALEALRDGRMGARPFVQTTAAALLAATFAVFFGGGVAEIVTAGAIGLVVAVLDCAAARLPWIARVLPCIAATAASALAVLAAWAWGSLATPVVVMSALILLMPGLSITTAVGELASLHWAAGTARLAYGVMTLFLMGFGVAVGRLLEGVGPAFAAPDAPAPIPGWTLWAGLALAPLLTAVLLNALVRDWGAVFVGAVTGFLVSRYAGEAFGKPFGAFAAAFFTTLLANFWARVARRPSAVILTPGFLMLVPGSIGFRSLASFVQSDVVQGVLGAFNVLLIAVAIVTGLFLAQQLLPPRDMLPRRGRRAA